MRMRDRIVELEKELLEAKKVKFFCDKDILTRAMLVTTEEEAKEYKQAYIKYVQKALKDKPRNDNTTAEQIVNTNLIPEINLKKEIDKAVESFIALLKDSSCATAKEGLKESLLMVADAVLFSSEAQPTIQKVTIKHTFMTNCGKMDTTETEYLIPITTDAEEWLKKYYPSTMSSKYEIIKAEGVYESEE